LKLERKMNKEKVIDEETNTDSELTEEEAIALEEIKSNSDSDSMEPATTETEETKPTKNKGRYQKKINKVTRKAHDSNRRAEKAEEELRILKEKMEGITSRLNQQESKASEKELKIQKDLLQNNLKTAFDEGDSEKTSSIVQKMTELNSEKVLKKHENLETKDSFEQYFDKNNPWYKVNKQMTDQAEMVSKEMNRNPEFSYWGNKQKLDYVSEKVESWNKDQMVKHQGYSMGVTNGSSEFSGNVSRKQFNTIKAMHPNWNDAQIYTRCRNHLERMAKNGN